MICPHCQSHQTIKKSFYFVRHSRVFIRRYFCKDCLKSFSGKTLCPTYRQKKPYLNPQIFKLLVSGNTQRGVARLLKCSKNTVNLKFLWLSLYHYKDQNLKPSLHLQIDEMESIEHTKLKPIAIPLCVDEHYQILSIKTGSIKAKGHLARISERKYGIREDQRVMALRDLLKDLKAKHTPLSITTDAHPLYPKLIKEYFPNTEHIQIISREKVKKQKELLFTKERKLIFDPMFALNQRCAKLRADIRRLTRRSWCTTKKIENLQRHLELYQSFNNQFVNQ